MRYNAVNVFRALIVSGMLTLTGYWFLPYAYGWLDSETGVLLSYAGYGAIWSGHTLLNWATYGLWMASSLALIYNRRLGREVLFVVIVFTTALVPLHGLSVETAGGTFLIDVTHLLYGAVLAMGYFSPVRDRLR